MASTRTATTARTFSRLDLMTMQVERILERCHVSEGTATKIARGIKEKWLAELSVYGLDSDGAAVAQLYMTIDWQKHEIHVAAGRETVTVDGRWRQGIAIEVEKALALFGDVCEAENLTNDLHARYRPGVDHAVVDASLGFKDAEPVKWRSGVVGSAMTIPEIDEVVVGVKIAVPDAPESRER